MIEVYKITHEIYDPLTTNLLLTKDLANINTRCHNFKLNKPRVNTKQFQYFFTNRIINLWNSLPMDLVNAKSINSFKNKIDIILNVHMFTTNYRSYHMKFHNVLKPDYYDTMKFPPPQRKRNTKPL